MFRAIALSSRWEKVSLSSSTRGRNPPQRHTQDFQLAHGWRQGPCVKHSTANNKWDFILLLTLLCILVLEDGFQSETSE